MKTNWRRCCLNSAVVVADAGAVGVGVVVIAIAGGLKPLPPLEMELGWIDIAGAVGAAVVAAGEAVVGVVVVVGDAVGAVE